MFRWAMYIIHDPRENLCKIIRRFSPFSVGKRKRRENGTKRESFVRLDDILFQSNSLMVTFEEIFEERSFLFIVISLQNTGGIIERMEETIINHR